MFDKELALEVCRKGLRGEHASERYKARCLTALLAMERMNQIDEQNRAPDEYHYGHMHLSPDRRKILEIARNLGMEEYIEEVESELDAKRIPA